MIKINRVFENGESINVIAFELSYEVTGIAICNKVITIIDLDATTQLNPTQLTVDYYLEIDWVNNKSDAK